MTPGSEDLSPASRDLGAFCARIIRFDPAILVRVDVEAVWAILPFDVLATRPLRAGREGFIAPGAYRAAEVLEYLSEGGPLPRDRSADWRGGPPPLTMGRVLERLPARELRGIADAAVETLRQSPPSLGERRVRDVLLDHVAVTVVAEGEGVVNIPLRLVLGLTRMGFLGNDPVTVSRSGGWTGLVAEYGAVWHKRRITLQTTGQR
ncbi:MAG: hypothetical protein H0T78_04270 [Longispora sp.]|nr:hypothetical protein [Longispora sp. (in: high G+C Gram-positive bacteria)]